MMGKNHATSAAVAWLTVGSAATAAAGVTGMDPSTVALGTLLCAGAGTLPDLDHPDAKAGRAFGIAGRAVATGIGTAAGGHRQRTHTLLFVVAMTAVAHWAVLASSPWPAAVLVAVCVTIGIGLVGPSVGLPGAAGVVAVALGAGSGWLIYSGTIETGEWITAAVALGTATHLIGDCATPAGCPLIWPASKARLGLPIFTTGGLVERVVGVALVAVLVYLAVTTFLPGLI